MEQYFIRDFTRADEYSIEIETGNRPLESVDNLRSLIIRVRDDIGILDEETKQELNKKNTALNKINADKKKQLELVYAPGVEDNVDENDISLEKLREDFQRYKAELKIIKQLGYKKQWLV